MGHYTDKLALHHTPPFFTYLFPSFLPSLLIPSQFASALTKSLVSSRAMKLAHFTSAGLPSCLSFLSLLLAMCFVQAYSTSNETDKLALLAFKASVKDPYGALDSWNGTIGFCQWYGVACGRRHGRVTVLYLDSLTLLGSISPHIGNLSFLSILFLPNNSLAREVPPQVRQLQRLRLLNLDYNSLSGEIPRNMSACSKLVGITIAYNQLTGVIPTELGSLPELRFLSFL